MQLGLNEDIIHKGERYHIQTEDGGRKNPLITTLLFKGGVVIASKRISYADILRFDKLDTVVREIMIEQHKEAIKNLLEGLYDRPEEKKAVERRPSISVPEDFNRGEAEEEKGMDDIILQYLSMDEKE